MFRLIKQMDKIYHYGKKWLLIGAGNKALCKENNEAKLDYNFSVNLTLVILHII